MKSKRQNDSPPSFLMELNRMEKLKKHRHLNSSDREKVRRLQGQLKAFNSEREAKGQTPLGLESLESKALVVSSPVHDNIKKSKTVVIESAPQIRNLQKELTKFVPTSVVLKRKNIPPNSIESTRQEG